MRTKATMLLAATAVGAFAATTLAAPANAEITLYDGTRYTAGWIRYYGSDSSYTGDTFSSGVALNDHISSVNNNNTVYTCLYEHANYTGNNLRLNPGVDLLTLSSTWDNKISSHKFSC
ncbi:peptidase inhibitor family I36 protein [Actinoplanes sp. NPDC049548]|uniref:peptidase inhibitor family I36 protein n=1 Tax=Actinoplanes sp. NPDC049548 TaxID=3155152 RepID=UPI003428234F